MHDHSVTIKQEENELSLYPTLYTIPSYAGPFSQHGTYDAAHNAFHFHPPSPPAAKSPYQQQYVSPMTNYTFPQSINFSAIPNYEQDITHYNSPISCQSRTPRPHIPRPPNAFMLFRSDFLKRGVIPSHVERRQQNLSRIAGQCWNLLSPDEKAKWQAQAAQVLVAHQKRNPDYKFTPAPRGSRRTNKAKGRAADPDTAEADGEDRIRQIREEYTQIAGPTAAPARRRRVRVQNRSRDLEREQAPEPESASVPVPASPSPSPSVSSHSHETMVEPAAPQFFPQYAPPPATHDVRAEPALPPFFPQYSFPHVVAPRRPSTSLGFATPHASQEGFPGRAGFALTRPSSAASETGLSTFLRDLDITPTTSTFGSISLSASGEAPPLPDAGSGMREAVPFSTLSGAFAAAEKELYGAGPESFLDALYASDPFAFVPGPAPPQLEYSPFEEAQFNFDAFTAAQGWDLGGSLPEAINAYTL